MRRWEDNINIDSKEIVREDVEWIQQMRDRILCKAPAYTVMNLGSTKYEEILDHQGPPVS
jgi:hypothetical protein